jgi:hypothetical protein
MVEYAGDCITNDEIIRAVHYILNRSRKDGWIPDRVYADGTAVYAAGITGHPIGEANLDTALFLTFIIFLSIAGWSFQCLNHSSRSGFYWWIMQST